MQIRTGIDLIYLPKFKKSLKNGGENFLQRVFLSKELTNTNPEHLAGIFAAKEAVMKALDLSKDAWHDIQIINEPDGAPLVTIPNSKFQISNCSLSISHSGDYVIAQFVALLR